MWKLSLAAKWILGILFGFGAVTTMMYYTNPGWSIFQYPGTIYDSILKKPKAPQIVDQYVEGGCGTRVHWSDNAVGEDGVKFYRRVVGQPNFDAIRITDEHLGIPGSFDDHNLPMGTYEYKVGVFNGYGESFSNISEQLVIDNAACGNDPLLIKPLNPLIVAVAVEGGCKARIFWSDNSLDEDGVRIYRWSFVDPNSVMIDELGPHAGVPGSYDDPDLPPTTYEYQVSVFNANGESFSNVSDDVVINDPDCEQISAQPQAQLSTPLVISVATKTPTPAAAQACIWKAAVNVFIRKGPGASLYPELTTVNAGDMLPVVGQSEDEFFWALKLDGDALGYVSKSEKFGHADGPCNVPVLQDPPPPPPPAQCTDGVDNDGDGLVDMSDRNCRNPDDNTEDR
ncbi:MAG TPA: hypothetical protein VGJ22_05860 [Anaerolineales bacterium]|jgi:hypothetical protein